MSDLKKNDVYTVQIESYSSEAFGVCRIDGQVVFVPGTLVGETWEIKIVKAASVSYGKALRCLRSSPARTMPECPYYGRCGGCDTCHMQYEEELRFKLQRVNDALQRIGKQTRTVSEILRSDAVEHYRNKGIFAVANVQGEPASGFYRPRSHDLIPVETCALQSAFSARAAAAVIAFMREHGIPAYDEKKGAGTVRHVFCRNAAHGKDAVLCIVSASGFGDLTQPLIAYLRKACPELTGIVLNVNRSKGNTVLAGDFYTLWGDAHVHDTLCGIAFEIAPQAFFQVNPPQAKKLYERAVDYALADAPDLVLDLYCGAGTISLCMARRARRVIGAEIVPEAVENAIANGRRNGIENAEFICADAGTAAQQLAARGLHPDVVVVDPPRKGLHESVIDAIGLMAPTRVVYVSCNPATLARDVLRFQELGYVFPEAAAVDMFPRTCHVETVVLLSKGEIDSKKVRVEFSLEDMDMSDFQDKATYTQIKDYVLEHSGLKVSNLYISQIKRKCGLEVGKNYNLPKAEDSRQPQCPSEKENAIREAMKYFGMI
ncbi:MAG: 23S rRNA (uracil(1939)-C(5))-methyltransferase RlmD [Oscillospiraceae bacterium]|nr:23S rRNA (uracil(1939)-C(5))-methyltransferase RlmD [Oscillospiraceae bacterium]